jgi:pyruvate formate lyase activating enzyme
MCGVRANMGGELIAEGYGRVSSVALDPIEKKPLYMFHPGKRVLSIGGFGCNLSCPYCQNYEISKEYGSMRQNANQMSPGDVAALAERTKPDRNIGVAYTYNEPLIGYEFVYECAELVRKAGLCNVLVTNGFINKEPLEELLPYIDAMNIDLKGYTDGFYNKVGGRLDAVKETIAICAGRCHVEVTTLVIPRENEDDVGEIAKWLSTVDPEIPLHITRFFPRYRYSDKPPTPRETIFELCETAKKHLKNVFAGNV